MSAAFAAGVAWWQPVSYEQLAPVAGVSPVNPTPEPTRTDPHSPEPHPKCAQTAAPVLTRVLVLWSARLTAGFAARVLPPPQHPGNTAAGSPRQECRVPTSPLAGQPATPEGPQPVSEIEWAVRNILRLKYPMIHREIIVGALEHFGHIPPGADPDFPDFVIGHIPAGEPEP